MTDPQPLDLDTIEAAYREVMNDDTEPISSAVLDVFCDIPALIAEIKRLRTEVDHDECDRHANQMAVELSRYRDENARLRNLARPESSCAKTLIERLQELEANREPPMTTPNDDGHVRAFNEGYEHCLDMLRSVLADHGIEVSLPDEDETPQPDPLDELLAKLDTDTADPLDENDHRDRQRNDGLHLTRRRASHWHTHGYWCEGDCDGDFSLHMWNKDHGPLAFADTPQPPPKAQKQPQTAPDRAALADIAQAAQGLSAAICDLLDGDPGFYVAPDTCQRILNPREHR